MKPLRFFSICLFVSFSIAFSNAQILEHKTEKIMAANLSYSWNAAFDAVTYEVKIKNQATNEEYQQETANTTADFNAPQGVYDITVTVKRADSSTYILISDVSEL